MSAKNCHTCEHLEYEPGDEWGNGAGWYCEKRDPKTSSAENKLIADMGREEYRLRYKRCFEPRPTPTHSSEAGDE